MKFLALSLLSFIMGISIEAQVALTRGDSTKKKIALVFTGDEFADGGEFINSVLQKESIRASFFFTGNFYRNNNFKTLIRQLILNGHYLGSHSDKHLLYCDWTNRDSLLVTKRQFMVDLARSYRELNRWGISREQAVYFLPPYEWYNDSIVAWTDQMGLQLINFTPGTRSTADYTYPDMGERYLDSKTILESIINYEQASPSGLNGFILLVHIGTDTRRKDKFYNHLPDLIRQLKDKQYQFVRINELLDRP